MENINNAAYNDWKSILMRTTLAKMRGKIVTNETLRVRRSLGYQFHAILSGGAIPSGR
jgi:hypothetical protein